MKVTILTARRITKAIDKLLGELVPLKQDRYGLRERSSNEHYIYPNSDDATLVGDLKIKETLNDFTILSNIKFALRLDIGKANEASDINNLQNKSKSIEALNNGLNSLIKSNKVPSFSTANNQFSVGISEGYLKTLKKQVQANSREIQEITDKCAVINSSVYIVIPDNDVEVLKNYDLLD